MAEVPHTSRIRGAIFGVLTCDALGGPPQSKKRGSYPRVTSLQRLEHFNRPAGAWSDDGSMTLCLAQSFIDTSLRWPSGKASSSAAEASGPNIRWDKADCILKFCAWHKDGYLSSSGSAFDVGHGTMVALDLWQRDIDTVRTGKPNEINVVEGQESVDMKLKTDWNSGNGSLMRCAPVDVVFASEEATARKVAREQSDVTHPSTVCGDACSLYAALISRAMKGVEKDALADGVAQEDVSARVLRERLGRYRSLHDWQERPEQAIKSSGWVVDSLEAALWCFFSTTNFMDGAVRAVNLGNDTDTIGAIYGGLAGAFYGIEAIPEDWRDGILRKDLVKEICGKLVEVVDSTDP